MASVINAVWQLMQIEFDFSSVGVPVTVSLWEIFMASTLIYILCVWTRYVTGRSDED